MIIEIMGINITIWMSSRFILPLSNCSGPWEVIGLGCLSESVVLWLLGDFEQEGWESC